MLPPSLRHPIFSRLSIVKCIACPEAQLADQGFVDVQNARAPAMDHMKGRWSRSRTSEHVASMFSGWRGVHRASSAIAGSSAVLGKTAFPLELTMRTFFLTLRRSRGAMGRYQGTSGRREQPPDGSDGRGGAMRNPRGGKRVNENKRLYCNMLLLGQLYW